ncbi:MAG TPA: ankyrin repeat domain-containing protein [Rickettsia endosymbiont of Columbicola hoogstraali]|nr:ankyrin repeat domain-containing protein [Rickettsia endosymbiont of Columbicola hoogstraali]
MHPTHIKFITPNAKDLDILCVALSLVKTSDQINDFKILIKQALNQGFDINMKDGDHCTLLYYSCTLKLYEIAQFLLENGADPNIRNTVYDPITPLSIVRVHPKTKQDYDKSFIVEQLPKQLIDKTEVSEFELTGKTAEVTSEIA